MVSYSHGDLYGCLKKPCFTVRLQNLTNTKSGRVVPRYIKSPRLVASTFAILVMNASATK